MGIFSKTKVKDELVLVFDVRSSSVGGALLITKQSGVPEIVFSVREPIVAEADMSGDHLLVLMSRSLEIVANKIHKSGLGAPKQIFCILAAPWYASQTRTIRLKKNSPFIFTSKLVDELINKEISIFKEEYQKQDGYLSNAIRSIEVKNVQILLNGYETFEPFNKKIKELELAIFIAMSPEQVLQKIEQSIGKYFHFSKIKFSSFVMASFAVVRETYLGSRDFLLIDIGGELTDISMAKRGVLHESSSFPLGLGFVIRRVAGATNTSFSEAKSFISLLKDGHHSEATAQRLKPVLNNIKQEWLKRFQNSLANLSNDISIPATIYITVDKGLASFFLETIEKEQFNQYTLTDSKFHINLLDTGVFHDMVVLNKGVMPDATLLLDSIYINHFLN